MIKLSKDAPASSVAPVREITESNHLDTLPVNDTTLAPLTSTALVPVGSRALTKTHAAEIIDFSTIRERAESAQPELLAKARVKKDGTDRRLDSIKDLAEGRSDEFYVSPWNLFVEEGWNSRDLTTPKLTAHIEWLAENIATNGVLQALEVARKGDRFVILDGHCRWYAVMLAISRGCDTLVRVPCKTPRVENPKLTDHLLSQILRNSGQKLNPVEEAEVLFKLRSHGMFPDEIAEKISKSVKHVNDRLYLRGAPDEVRAWVSHEKISVTAALKVLRSHEGNEKAAVREIAKMIAKMEAENLPKINQRIVNAVTGKAAVLPKPLREVDTILRTAEVKTDPVNKKTAIILDTEVYEKILALGLLAPLQPLIEGPSESAAEDEADDEGAEQAA